MPKRVLNTTENDDVQELYKFIGEKCKGLEQPVVLMQLAKDFQQETGSRTNTNTIISRINRYRNILPDAVMDLNAKIRMMFALGTPIEPAYLTSLQSDATVHLDHKRRISVYESLDGSLTLRKDGFRAGNHVLRATSVHVTAPVRAAVPPAPTAAPPSRTTKPRAQTVKVTTRKTAAPARTATSPTRSSAPQTGTATSLAQTVASSGPSDTSQASSAERVVKIEVEDEVVENKPQLKDPLSQPKDEPLDEQPEMKQELLDTAMMDSTSHKAFIWSMETLYKTLDIPMKRGHTTKLNETVSLIAECVSAETDFPNAISLEVFESGLQYAVMLVQAKSILQSSQEFRSLPEFLSLFKFVILGLKLPQLENVTAKIDTLLKSPASKDKVVPVDKLNSALHSLMDLVLN